MVGHAYEPHPFTGAQASSLPFLEDAEPSLIVSIKSPSHTHSLGFEMHTYGVYSRFTATLYSNHLFLYTTNNPVSGAILETTYPFTKL